MEKIIFCFEIRNQQDDYSALMQIMDLVENGNRLKDSEEMCNICNLRYCWLRGENVSVQSQIEIAIRLESEIAGKNKEKYWKLHQLRQLDRVLEKKNEYDFRYYIRIRTDEDVKNVQYAILLLQQFRKVQGRIQFFFIPFTDYYTASSIEWKHISTYYKYSHFLRFILSKYRQTFFGAYYDTNAKQVKVLPLSSKKVGVQSSFFPLIEIDQDILCIVTKYCIGKTSQNLYDEFPLLIELKEISKKILSNRLKVGMGKKAADKNLFHIEKVMLYEYATVLEYALFSVLIPEKSELTEKIIKDSLEQARNIADGMIQIIENIILHSYNRKGIFTFRIVGHEDKQLEIDISDANLEETILDNFKKKLGKAIKYFDDISLNIAQFFGEFSREEEESAWKAYRNEYPIKCLGLQRLSQELNRCSATLKVRSNTCYRNNKPQLFYKNSEFKTHNKESENTLYIPGTQYQISIPIFHQYVTLTQHNANVFLNAVGGLIETDSAYAKFVDYRQQHIEFENICVSRKYIVKVDKYFYNILDEGTENEKEQMVQLWCDSWNIWERKIKYDEKNIYYLDLMGIRELISPWGIEVFCKGLTGSKVFNSDGVRYFALINANEELMKMLFETIILSKIHLNEKLQVYVHLDNDERSILICGKDSKEIIRNAFQYCFSKGDIPDFLPKQLPGEIKQNIELCPFDALIIEDGYDKTLFEKYVEKLADKPLTSNNMAGYRLEKSHMRLGNKVHLKGFYELSILFRKPYISKKLALLIIRKMMEEGMNVLQNLLFFGYASYSRSILTSLVEITKHYHMLHNEKNHFIEFAVYQNDIMIQKTLTDISPKVRMYLSCKIPENEDVSIIQIVPISTTLTTFKKMWDMFCEEMQIGKKRWHLEKNYTLFWVRDLGKERKPTEIEEEYWTEIKNDKSIKTHLINPTPKFFCCKKTEWYNPLNCRLCYPENVLDEIALIETDVTSTVPSQQLEVLNMYHETGEKKFLDEEISNETRVINLKDCVYYGHVSRDGNHFQYYIDTVAYFQKQKEDIAAWLKKKAETDGEHVGERGALNIIVTPHHHTNVEFGHYVNEYYFRGTADIISIDSSKEYRSNIVIKYADIKETINNAYRIDREVRFTYVDDTIITGTTFKRVNNLLHSLVPKEKTNVIQINKVFVLVNRLSAYNKLDYVRNMEDDFYAFVNLNISSIRNFGDSCTMCTLMRNSQLFQKRASTLSIAHYWDKKHDNYKPISFDKYLMEKTALKKIEKGYIRMLCSHYAKSNLNISEDMVSSICSIINLMLKLRQDDTESPIYSKVLLKYKKEALQGYLKVLVRPFFSYGRIYRQSILDLFLMMTEYFLNPSFKNLLVEKSVGMMEISNKKQYMNDKNLQKQVLSLCRLIEEIIPLKERLFFIQAYLLEGLTDLRSNYIIRKVTLKNMCRLIKQTENPGEQYDIYSQMIHRLINSSADETKSLWFEYLLTTGQENVTGLNNYEKIDLADIGNKDRYFQRFWEILFIENTRLCYDSMLNFVKKASIIQEEQNIQTNDAIYEAVKDLWGDYYIRNLRRFIQIEILAKNDADCEIDWERNCKNEDIEHKIQEKVEKMVDLLWLLKRETAGGLERYNKLKICVESLLYEGDQLWIFTMALAGIEKDNELCLVTDDKEETVSQESLARIKEALRENFFEEKGFYIGSNYIIICIRDYYESSKKQIQPLYFYIQCSEADTYKMIHRVRTILMYRHQILHWTEADFNNNALPILVEQINANRQLMRDKAGDHSSRTDISSVERLLQTKYDSKKFENLYRWILLRQYVNMRVARVFRSEWSRDSKYIKDKLYSTIQNVDEMNKPMVNLGESFFGTTLGPMSPSRYLESVFDMFEFTIDIDNHSYDNVDMETMKKLFFKMHGREENGYYYKQEYIICMFLDILFSAIRTCRNWVIDYDIHRGQLDDMLFMMRENQMITYYHRLSKDEEKCTIWIRKEASCLIFRNIVVGMMADEIEDKNKKLREQIRTKETKGLSLQAIKWYVESLGSEGSIQVSFEYEWNKETGKVEFVTKLPILREEEQVE